MLNLQTKKAKEEAYGREVRRCRQSLPDLSYCKVHCLSSNADVEFGTLCWCVVVARSSRTGDEFGGRG